MNFRSYYILNEMAAKSISNEALFINKDRTLFTIYDPKIASQGLRKFDEDIMLKSILGAIEIRHNRLYNVSEVEQVAAEHGWGPTLYQIAMHFAPNGLTANRTPKISDDAKTVWQHFYNNQATHKEPLHPDAQSHHKEDFLNHRYRLLNSILPMIRIAVENSKRLIGRDENGDKSALIENAAETYLREKMDDIYG